MDASCSERCGAALVALNLFSPVGAQRSGGVIDSFLRSLWITVCVKTEISAQRSQHQHHRDILLFFKVDKQLRWFNPRETVLKQYVT